MIEAPIGENEAARLDHLFKLNILDTPAEDAFDNLVKLAASITGCPISLISIVGVERQWFKSSLGLNAIETARDISFCGHAIEAGDDIFEVEDASKDLRFFDNPLVSGDPNISYYAGQPLKTSDGYNIGTICVIDRVPNKLTNVQRQQLKLVGDLIVALIESSKEADKEKEESRKKTAFVSAMSHEIRTPLTAISGYIDVIDKEVKDLDNSNLRNAIKVIQDSSSHLNDLVGDILDFSKLDARKVTSESEPVAIRELLNQIHSFTKLEAMKKGLEYRIEIAQDIPKCIYSDSIHIKQMVLNLLSNAIKFTDEGAVTLKANFNKDTELLNISVVDTGIGMTQEEVSRIFSPYEQANSGISKKFKGTGLGMPISKEIAELMGGSLSVIKTTKGEGSHFQVQLPVKIHQQLKSKTASAKLVSTQIDEIGDISKILVVDDVAENRFLLKHFLKDYNFVIDEAKDAQEAFDLMNSDYDVVFLDMNLPDMNGRDLFKKLSSTHKKTKFVAFTASTHAQDRLTCYKDGFSSFLSKPFDTAAIIKSLKTNQEISIQ